MTDLQLIKICVQQLKALGFGSQKEIGQKLGYSNESSFSQVLNGKVPLPADLMDRVANFNVDIKNFIKNIKEEDNEKDETNASLFSSNPNTTELPLITVASRASFNYEVFHDNSMVYERAPIYRLAVKGLKKPVLIDIDGDSMTPQLAPGTRVLADEVDCGDWNYITGVVAVSFKNQFVVKRIKENHSIETKSITLYSDNEMGGSFPVRLADINAIWKVLEIVKAKVE